VVHFFPPQKKVATLWCPENCLRGSASAGKHSYLLVQGCALTHSQITKDVGHGGPGYGCVDVHRSVGVASGEGNSRLFVNSR
jgi:hypothetical protein